MYILIHYIFNHLFPFSFRCSRKPRGEKKKEELARAKSSNHHNLKKIKKRKSHIFDSSTFEDVSPRSCPLNRLKFYNSEIGLVFSFFLKNLVSYSQILTANISWSLPWFFLNINIYKKKGKRGENAKIRDRNEKTATRREKGLEKRRKKEKEREKKKQY